MPLVGGAVSTTPPYDHGHVGQPLGVLSGKGLSQFSDMVPAIGLQAPHKFAGAAPRQDVIVRPVPNELSGWVSSNWRFGGLRPVMEW